MKPTSKWDLLLERELKPRPIDAHLVTEAAKLLAKELRGAFPPEVGGLEGPDAARFAPLFDEPQVRPGDDVYRAAFHLARLELQHELEEADAFVRRSPRPDRDRLAMLFLARWLTEQLYTLKELLQTPLPRARLVEIVEQAEQRLLAAQG